MISNIRFFLILIFLFTLVIYSCGSSPDTSGNNNAATQQFSGGLAEEIRTLTQTGVLSSMLDALELIRVRDLTATEFGRLMSGINVLLIRLVYPDSPARLPVIDLPQTSLYTRIIREAERGVYTRPPSNSTDFFEHILPFLAINNQTTADVLSNALRDLEKAGTLQPNSVLPSYLIALIHERAGRYNEAEAAYARAYNISNGCYSAQIGIGRIKRLSGNTSEAVNIFSELVIRFPDSSIIRRELAISYFVNKDWSRALSSVDEILRTEPRDGEIILLRAAIMIEQGQFSQANISLDSYASINPNNRTYLFLRARVQAEGNRNRDSALNYLRSILRANPDDLEVMTYASALLMESPRPSDQAEGRELLERLRQVSGSSADVLSLSLRDAIHRESWQEALNFLNLILTTRRTDQDLIDGYLIEHNLRNNTRAFNFARELYERDNSNHDYTVIYISALIDNGRRDEASRLLENRLGSANSGPVMSRYYFQRSRLQTNQDMALNDLRSSLFEDPRNLDAIIAMFEIYHRRREERRAVHYLRQALAIAPDHPLLRRYEREYASLLGRN